MSWFRKEEKMNMETGKFEEEDGRRRGTPVSDALLAQDPNSRKNRRAREREAYRESKARAREEYHKAFTEARIKRARERGRQAGSTTWNDRLDNLARPPPPRRRPSTGYSVRNNYNPFGSMFDTGINYNRPRKKTSSKKRYTVVGGKAYPIAGSKKKGKKRKTSSKSYDPFNAFGGYKL